jgi:hypothetical protein
LRIGLLRSAMLGLAALTAMPLSGAGAERPKIEEPTPLPPARPEELGGAMSREGTAPPPAQPAEAQAPPAPDPALGPALPDVAAPLPPPRPGNLEAENAADDAAEEACLARLTQLGIRFEKLPPVAQGSCGAARPLRVSGLPDGVEIAPAATTLCPVAEALAKWVQESARPEASQHLGKDLAKILNGTSYECRGQSRQSGAKLSEHAFANALDVMGFAFRGRPDIAVAAQNGDTPEARFLAAVRASACRYFSTVLGPGSDAAHADHLHLDLRARRAGMRLCQ